MVGQLVTIIRRLHERYIGVFIQLTLGLSILIAPTVQGGVVSFLERHTPIHAPILGGIMIASAVIGGVGIRKTIYAVTLTVFALWSLIACIGMASNEVTFQSFVFSLGVFLYALRAFADGNGNGR